MQSPSKLASLGLLRNVSTLFGFLTIARYSMGAFFTHVCCLSRSVSGSGWVDKEKMLIPVAAGIASYYIINPGIIKTRTRRFSLDFYRGRKIAVCPDFETGLWFSYWLAQHV